MHARLVSKPNETRIWFAVLDPGEEVKQALTGMARTEGFEAASFVALGAFERARIAWFDWQAKQYRPIPIDTQVEVITLTGDIVPDDKGKLSLHAHVVLGLADGHTRGGHLVEGIVRPTLEVTVTETPAHLVRRRRPEWNLALIDAGQGSAP